MLPLKSANAQWDDIGHRRCYLTSGFDPHGKFSSAGNDFTHPTTTLLGSCVALDDKFEGVFYARSKLLTGWKTALNLTVLLFLVCRLIFSGGSLLLYI